MRCPICEGKLVWPTKKVAECRNCRKHFKLNADGDIEVEEMKR